MYGMCTYLNIYTHLQVYTHTQIYIYVQECIWLNCGRGLIWGLFLFLGHSHVAQATWWSGIDFLVSMVSTNMALQEEWREEQMRFHCCVKFASERLIRWPAGPAGQGDGMMDPWGRWSLLDSFGLKKSGLFCVEILWKINYTTKCEHSPEVEKPLFTIYFFYVSSLRWSCFNIRNKAPNKNCFPLHWYNMTSQTRPSSPGPPTLNLAPT